MSSKRPPRKLQKAPLERQNGALGRQNGPPERQNGPPERQNGAPAWQKKTHGFLRGGLLEVVLEVIFGEEFLT